MSKNCLCLGFVALLSFGPGSGRAQTESPELLPSPALAPAAFNASVPLTSAEKPAPGLSSWIVGTDPDCCGNLSDRTPLKTELYMRSGLSFPTGNSVMANSLDTGWAIEGGARALFNSRGDAAWTLSLGVLNVHNVALDNPPAFTILNLVIAPGATPIPSLQAHVRALNQTFVTLGAGREWYMLGAASGTRDSDWAKWRIGYDLGGRWGTGKAELFETRHRTDTLGGAYAAIHSDIDITCGCCTFYAGIRSEYQYTWTDILQAQNKSDLGGVNVLFSLGVRY